MIDVLRVALAARVFTVAVIVSTAVVGNASMDGVWLVLVIASCAEALSFSRALPEGPIVVVEGMFTAAAAAISFPAHEAAFPYLAAIGFYVSQELFQAVSAELFEYRLRQGKRDHGFADRRSGRHGADVRALVMRFYRRFRLHVHRGERRGKRG